MVPVGRGGPARLDDPRACSDNFGMSTPRYRVVDFADLPGVACPCGTAYRAFTEVPEFPGTIHRTEIHTAAKPHFHRVLTETYYILECDPKAYLELDGDIIPVHPGMCILIPPGVVHRAVGRMVILNIVFPKFDPADEVVVDNPSGEQSPGPN